jgi:Uma2 family endonuclease
MNTITPVNPPSPASPSTLLTAAEFAQRHGGEYVELVEGQVRGLPMPFPKHGRACALMTRFLDEHAEKNDLGRVMSNDSFVQTRTNPDTVRGADVCFYSYERLPKGAVPEGLLPVVPDLVVEVRSPSERWVEVYTKVIEYLQAGVRVVVVLDAATTTASVFRTDELQQIVHNGDELTIPEVLPGFAVPVQRLFE